MPTPTPAERPAVVMYGNLVRGLYPVGPFPSFGEASDYARRAEAAGVSPGEYIVMTVYEAATVAPAEANA
jgi:hypothetical protein